MYKTQQEQAEYLPQNIERDNHKILIYTNGHKQDGM